MRTIKQYVRDGNRQKVGVLLCGALPTGDDKQDVVVGYSFCNTKKDSFNHMLGHRIAAQRGNAALEEATGYGNDDQLIVKCYNTAPSYAYLQFYDFCKRCLKYFKTDMLLIL